ncbi:hypothetical protein ACIBSW_11570 [Actinoplanes sp. NPDC049668]|uniref:hypothetical protein n=1 Tax=unclassified Actinoplanes TaxID=2626549 RepID=UPI0033BCD8CE
MSRRRRLHPPRRRPQRPDPWRTAEQPAPAPPVSDLLPWHSIRWALVINTVVIFVAVAAAGLAVDEDPETMPIWPLLPLAIPVVAALRASLRRSRDVLSVLRNTLPPMAAVFVLGIAQLPLIYPLWLIDEHAVPYAFVAIFVGTLVGGGSILILLLMTWASLFFAVGAPPGTSVLRRSLVGLLFLFMLMTAFGVALGAVGPRGRCIGTVLARLIWAEPTSPWLWIGRAGAIGLVVVVVLMYRTFLPSGRRAPR